MLNYDKYIDKSGIAVHLIIKAIRPKDVALIVVTNYSNSEQSSYKIATT